jgi:hypothetical protein
MKFHDKLECLSLTSFFQFSLIFVGKARAYPSEARVKPEPTQVKHLSFVPENGKPFAVLTSIELVLKGLPGTICCSLLQKFVNYVRKKFYNIGLRNEDFLSTKLMVF